ncbi:MAG: DUF1588 domain-containing protein [Lentisphaeraceae bacterium]|nr:DUF1588 domain-containing protein [Lentisphaeraceae bacterium]
MKSLLMMIVFFLQIHFINAAEDRAIAFKNYDTVIKPFIKKYCYTCHDDDVQKGDINFLDHPERIGTQADAQLWQDVLDVLNLGEMPPKKAKRQPTKEEIEETLDVMSNSLKFVRLKLSDSGVKPVIRRLNRREYKSTIEDLLGLQVNENNLPEDDLVNNFDTVGEALSFSSLHFEKFFELGKKLAKDSVTLGVKQKPIKQRWEVEDGKNKHVERVKQRSKKELEAKSQKAFLKPLKELNEKEKKEIGFYKNLYWTSLNYQASPAAKTGFLTSENAHPKSKRVYITVPKVSQEGDYIISMPIGFYSKKKIHNPDVKLTITVIRSNNGEPEEEVTEFKITNSYEKPEIVNVKTRLTAEDTYQIVLSSPNKTIFKPVAWIDYVELRGPIKNEWPPKSYKAIFPGAIVPKDSEGIRKLIVKFAKKAFRNKVPEKSYIDGLVKIFDKNRTRGESIEDALIEPLAVILSSPYFIYKSEQHSEYIADRELAVRLSYLIWNTMPDPLLLRAAENGELKHKDNLEQHIIRLLKNKRSDRFLETFTSQWLGLEKMNDLSIAGKKSRSGYPRDLVYSASQEPIELFKFLLFKNLSIENLIQSNFVMVNEVLAKNYGMKNVHGREFRLVKLPKGSPYGGLVTQASTMMMTSHNGSTSPIERGAFILRKILNTPPNPPPPNVPEIPNDKAMAHLTPREKITKHSESAQCSSCHRKIDPLGFAFENYDTYGRWREHWQLSKNKKSKIDASGEMYDGSAKFSGPHEMKEHLTSYTKNTAEAIIESLIIYGLGRNISFSDKPWVDRLTQNSQDNGFKLRSLIIDFLTSPEFRK